MKPSVLMFFPPFVFISFSPIFVCQELEGKVLYFYLWLFQCPQISYLNLL